MAEVAGDGPNEDWNFWHRELTAARKVRGFETWQKRAKKIIKRYRDERADRAEGDSSYDGASDGSRFNILWSNTQTLKPAVLAKAPKPVVARRYLDRDEVGRTASTILERVLSYELDDGTYYDAIKAGVLDWLLPGRGVAWVRYEARFMPMPGKTQEAAEPDEAKEVVPSDESTVPETRPQPVNADQAGADKPPPPARVQGSTPGEDEQVASESVPVDYVDWEDFDTSPARTWPEVWWISKQVYMDRDELRARFKGKTKGGRLIADIIPLDWTPEQSKGQSWESWGAQANNGKKARIREIWDKRKRRVIWMAPSWNEALIEEIDDPLKLEGFWPVPRPLFAVMTNNTLIPVPFPYEYQDQAIELDDLTARICALTKAIKAAGCYDASFDALKRMLEEGFENKLVPVDNWAEFSQKVQGGGGVWLLPMKDLIETLIRLYEAREQVKQVIYEITGISDIVRGQGSGAAKTATEQRIKGQFGSMRLNDLQAEVARFARDVLVIMGEIISEHFDPMTLYLVSGFEQYAKEQWPPEQAPAMPSSPMMGHNGGPPLPPVSPVPGPGMVPPAPGGGVLPPPPGNGAAGGVATPLMAPPGQLPLPVDPAMAAREKSMQMFAAAVKLLRDDKLRGFRIDIETDSLIEPDQQQTQQARSEFLAAVGQFLAQAVPLGQTMPQFMPLLGRMLLFGVRGFRAGHDLEAAFEQLIDDLAKAAKNPPPTPPSPEELKAQAAQQQAAMDAQAAQQKLQGDMELIKANLQAKQVELEIERQRAQIEREKMAMEMQREQAKHRMEIEKMAMQTQAEQQSAQIRGAAEQHAASLDTEAREREHAIGLETLEAKAAAAKAKPNGAST